MGVFPGFQEREVMMKKKILSLLTAIILVTGLSVPVYAESTVIREEYLSAAQTGFSYEHSPMENKKISGDIIVNPDAVYGFSPNPASAHLGVYAANDWSDGVFVNKARRDRMAAYKAGKEDVDPALDACLGLYDYYFTAYVTLGLAEAYSPEDEAFVSGWGENRPSDELWAEYEDVYRNPVYFDSASGDIKWPANDGFYGESFDYTLKPYTYIDRYGSDYGTFAALVGHQYPDYSLSPGTKYKNYSIFIVKKPIKAKAGAVYPWFDEPGLATQILLPAPVKDLLEDGSLERVPAVGAVNEAKLKNETFVKTGTVYDMKMILDNDPAKTNAAKVWFDNYKIFDSDKDHAAKDGYEWRCVDAHIAIGDDRVYKKWSSCNEVSFIGEYYQDNDWDGDRTTVNYLGKDYDCNYVQTVISEERNVSNPDYRKFGWSGEGTYTFNYNHAFLVPKGFDGMYVGFADATELNTKNGDYDAINNQVLFRLN